MRTRLPVGAIERGNRFGAGGGSCTMATRDVSHLIEKRAKTRTVLSDTTLGGKLKRNCHNAESAYRCRVPDASARDGGPAGARVAVGERVPRCGRALRMGLTRSSGAWHPSPAGASARVLRARQPSISLAGLGTDATKRDARLGRADPLLSPLRASPLAGTACVCARFPSTTTSRVSSVTFARWPRTRPAESSWRAARIGGAALEDGRDDDRVCRQALPENAGERRRSASRWLAGPPRTTMTS